MAETLMPNIVPDGLTTLFDHTHVCIDGLDYESDTAAEYACYQGIVVRFMTEKFPAVSFSSMD